ncbi:single-stranded-DNA-specific exonuclease RecJ [Peribacillus cavernae]|uniref:Single-stranded-DNA-specific exonuclease RecJ n=1 Tax=Peribacillus cavernae TaxID=1674310 RepID=A0A3S0TZ03_9BACI|nr:single-stranded-DNA-specific exonuclease RecJ [Peribacillus cavernae]MDQ0219327.1 single-stranded-DNA-specific exonuclease [Peribacillus cavernae]RUQ27792.1 single-stranded-DNA-specific exonuclease RecJ [Peribacillus cavernae]
MLKPKTRWRLQAADEKVVQVFVDELQITPLVARLLANRGIQTIEEAQSFLFINEQAFHDPFLLKDMDKAVQRIKQAIEAGEKIRIFGDYDADGVSSTSVMMIALTQMGANVDFYIPNRFTEGYGPNEKAFQFAAEAGVKLLITVDTGISAIHEAKVARELGLDYIVTDHHEPGPVLPEALAIIHPKLEDHTYPFKELAGVGVAFKLAHALLGHLPEDLLEIAAIGTIADLVPLHGENRLIAARGIHQLRHTKRPGLLSLIKKAGIQLDSLNEESIGFGMAPRINAAGRLGAADPTVDLIMAPDFETAEELATEIDSLNKERQGLVAEIAAEAIREVEENYPPEENGVLVVGKEGWNSGIIGIVASKLVDRFYRPAIVFSYDREKGLAKGSARSIEDFDMFRNLSQCGDILPHFGGHPMAAGMTLKMADVDELRRRLNSLAHEQLTEEDFTPVTKLDSVIAIEDITLQSVEELDLLAPFGMSNPKPKILIESANITGIRKIGTNQNHLKLQLGNSNISLDGVGFGLGYLYEQISPISSVSVIGELSINEWNNIRKPQIFLKDVAVNSWQLFDYRGINRVEKWLADIPQENRKVIVFSEETLKQLPFIKEIETLVHITTEKEAKDIQIDGCTIVLLDMPSSQEMLEHILRKKQPHRIYVHFQHQQDHFFSTMPTREHFKWFYAFLAKKGPLDVRRYGDELAKYRGWSRDTIDFISQVFLELDFVTIENGFISLKKHANKRDLGDAPSFKRKQEQYELEKELVYSSYQQLYDWFNTLVHEATDLKEETKQWI